MDTIRNELNGWPGIVCVKSRMGDLGFKKLRDFNLAMLAKQDWRLMNNDNPLVTKFMKARYYADTEILDSILGAKTQFYVEEHIGSAGGSEIRGKKEIW